MWFRSPFDALLARPSRMPARPRRPRSLRLLLEALEDRNLPSTYVVNTLTDAGAGSGLTGDLRYCVTNSTSGNDTITIGVTGTINLQSPLPALNANVDIQGPGAGQVTVDGGEVHTPYFVTAIFTVGSAANVQISGLTLASAATAIDNGGALALNSCTLTNNYVAGLDNTGSATVNDSTLSGNVNTGAGGAIYNLGDLTVNNSTISNNTVLPGSWPLDSQGGAIYNDGNLTVNDSTIADNNAQCSATSGYAIKAGTGYGGGLYMAGGTLSINSSTIAGNVAAGADSYYSTNPGDAYGGGLFIGGGTVAINNSTFADNLASAGVNLGGSAFDASEYGGGLYIGGGTVSIANSTLAGNQALGSSNPYTVGYTPAPGYGGGIDSAAPAGALQMYDTILADNSAYDLYYGDGPDLNGNITSLGHNLIGNTAGGSGFVASDIVNVSPRLGPLQDNGGPTQTMALLASSPAIDAGDNTDAPAYDQRGPGYPRIVNGTIDIGAFEVQNGSSNQAASLAVTGFPTVVTAGTAGSFTVTALNADGTTDTSYTGTVRFGSSDVQASLPAVYTFTAADDGVHSFIATLKTAGMQSITATDLTFGTTGTESGINVTPAAASQLAFAQQPSTTTAGQAIRPSVTVDVEDRYGNLVSSDSSSTMTVTLSSGTFAGGSNTASAQASGGVATFSTFTIDKAGSYTLKATDASLTPALSAGFTIQSAAASSMTVAGFPSPTTAGAVHNFTITLKDAYGNVATSYTGTVHFSSSDGLAGLPANYTFTPTDAGVHTFGATLKTAGTQSITATDTVAGSLTGTNGGIIVNPAAASKFVLSAPSSVNAGVAFSLTVTVEDAYGNVVSGYTGTVHFSSTDSTARLPSNYTFTAADKGVHSFSGVVLRKKGSEKITITDTLNSALTGSVTVDVL